MCTGGGDCGGSSSCVAGRCVAQGAVAAISTARRMLYDPVEIGFVRRGAGGELPAIAAFGRGDGALAFLRFAVALPPDAGVVEAYLLLDRVTAVDSDPEPVSLHVARVVDAWDARSLSWAMQPRIEEVGSPVTRVLPASGPVVRLDVRAIVERWRRAGHTDRSGFGVAVVAGPPGPDAALGMPFALAPRAPPGDRLAAADGAHRAEGAVGALAPRLELYLR
jgi:hypothetical protein